MVYFYSCASALRCSRAFVPYSREEPFSFEYERIFYPSKITDIDGSSVLFSIRGDFLYTYKTELSPSICHVNPREREIISEFYVLRKRSKFRTFSVVL